MGTPLVLCKHGWLLVYHVVHQTLPVFGEPHHLVYSTGIMIIDEFQPDKILYRSPLTALEPKLTKEFIGILDSVVFPTGIDRRDDLGCPNRFEIYSGMPDNCIGAVRIHVPDTILSDLSKS